MKNATPRKALIVDDQPEFLDYAVEFIEAQGLTVEKATTLPDALTAVTRERYKLVLVDMNIPAIDGITPEIRSRAPIVDKYPGIALAKHCRNIGYGAHSVVGYTVHDDDSIAAELEKLGCRYVLKGRPEAFKHAVKSSLAPPTR
jgi:CheY-like chemotaxis protein